MTIDLPIYLRVGDGEESKVATASAASASKVAESIADALFEIAKALVRAGEAGQEGFTLAPPTAPDDQQSSPKGSAYDLSNDAARAAWPSPPPTPGG